MLVAPASQRPPAELRRRQRLAYVLGLALWGLYVFTASPGLGWYDAGELVAAAHTLGVAHPTGFPLWTLLAKGAALVPVGSVALRVTLLGAASLVAAALLAGELAARWVSPRHQTLAFGAAALAVGLASCTWRHATSAEVYCLHLALVAGLALGVDRLAARPSAKGLATLALVAGLGLANHGELRLLGVALAMGTALALGRRLPARAWLWGVLAGLAGLLTYAYLPVRAAAGAGHLWDEVQHLDRLWAHVTAARILQAFRGEMWQLRGPLARLYAGQLGNQLWADTGGLTLLAPVGVGLLLWGRGGGADAGRRRRATVAVVVVGGMGAIDLAYSFLVNPMGLRDVQVGQIAAWAVAVLGTVGAARLATLLRTHPAHAQTPDGAPPQPARGRALAVATWLTVAAALAHIAWADLGDKAHPQQVAPAALATASLDAAEPHAIVLTTTDSVSAGLLHGRLVEGARPDLRHAVRQHLWNGAGRRHVAGLLPRDAPPTATAVVAAQLGRLPLRWEPGAGEEEAPLLRHLRPGLPTWRVVADAVEGPPPHVSPAQVEATLRRWQAGSTLTDGGRQAWAEILNYVGWHAASADRPDVALDAFRRALAVHPGSSRALNNLSVLASRAGELGEALEWARRAVHVNPASRVAQVNRGRYALALRQLSEATEAFQEALALDPACVPALAGLAAALANQGELHRARALLEQALRINPNDEEALANMAKVVEVLRRGAGSKAVTP